MDTVYDLQTQCTPIAPNCSYSRAQNKCTSETIPNPHKALVLKGSAMLLRTPARNVENQIKTPQKLCCERYDNNRVLCSCYSRRFGGPKAFIPDPLHEVCKRHPQMKNPSKNTLVVAGQLKACSYVVLCLVLQTGRLNAKPMRLHDRPTHWEL